MSPRRKRDPLVGKFYIRTLRISRIVIAETAAS
jgi:hypothetical protein